MPHDPWDPGLTSEIPGHLLPLVTLYRPENATVDYATAKDAASFCGLEPKDMIGLRLERLIIHELLIRVTADLSVPDGPNYEELGLNLRGMVRRIYDVHVVPELDGFRHAFDAFKRDAETLIRDELSHRIFDRPTTPAPPRRSFWARISGRETVAEETPPPENLALAEWREALVGETDPLRRACLGALLSIVGGIMAQRGRLMADADILTGFAVTMVANQYGNIHIGSELDALVRRAAEAEGYRLLPAQAKPFFMNVKGASASGKSTIRPQQRALAEKLDVPWEDFALISPDYWRKYLLDYESLGADAKYGAMLTGQELELIDRKLDTYMAEKAAGDRIPHLLIDRFRFDSFSTDAFGNKTTQLLTRFGDTVFLFFLVTPPAATVERAYKRGLETGRFKAVDDLLYHNIEAYTGMPQLFLNWIGSKEKKIHFEFLDNSVAFGELPRTIAYGWNDRMVVLDVEALHNIDRFRAVNVEATRPDDVLLEAPELTFLDHCVAEIAEVLLVDPESREVSAKAENGRWIDVAEKMQLSEAVFEADRALTLGAWSSKDAGQVA